MRILIITQWFNPEPAFKGLTFARELKSLGHEVQVLTGFPNYPGGEVYPGYHIRPLLRETMEGISVIRVPLYPSHDKSGLRRMINYISFAFAAATFGLFAVKKVDVAYVYHPPATVGLVALVFKLFRRVPFVYDIQDLWPDTLNTTGMVNSKGLLKMVDKWCRFVYKQASHITVLSPGFKKALVKRGVPQDKIEVIKNWTEEEHIQSLDSYREETSKELGLHGYFNVIFAGTMGQAQALDVVLSAASILEEKLPKVQFVFVGGGVDVPRLKNKAQEMALKNVIFLPRRPVSEIGEVLALAEVLLVHLKDDPLFKITIPSKIQAYMAAGKPILIGVKGDAAALVEEAGAGVACLPEDPQSIAQSVEDLYNLDKEKLKEMGKRGRDFYERELSLKVGVSRFEKVFRKTRKTRGRF